jgi:cellulose synthase/poly-beta-1,6-N-acetylglucosamine synthase-like glycosyltransferase
MGPLPLIRPTVSVQLPIYNEKYVVRRLVSACAEMAEMYGKDRVNIIVLDDSDDDTVFEVNSVVEEILKKNFRIQVFRRGNRQGFKAGVLQAALQKTPEDFVAIFDADFIPPKDFLNRTIPYLVQNPQLGVVQSRWGHLNRNFNQLTKAVAIAIDMHFLIDQTGRYAANLFQNFNGSGGVLRKQAILEAGGWQADTLAEDLDLSYRLQMKGYKILYLKDLESPGEIPPTIPSYKKQQGRWACGSLRTARKLLPALFSDHDIGFKQRLEGFIHLTSYIIHPLMTLSFLITCLSTLMNWNRTLNFNIDLPSSISGTLNVAKSPSLLTVQMFMWTLVGMLVILSTLAPWISSFSTLRLEQLSFSENLFSLVFLSILGFGISPDNTLEAGKALFSNKVWAFARTPKYAAVRNKAGWRTRNYQISLDPMWIVDLAFSGLGIMTIVYALMQSNYFPIFFIIPFTIAYLCILSLTLIQSKH